MTEKVGGRAWQEWAGRSACSISAKEHLVICNHIRSHQHRSAAVEQGGGGGGGGDGKKAAPLRFSKILLSASLEIVVKIEIEVAVEIVLISVPQCGYTVVPQAVKRRLPLKVCGCFNASKTQRKGSAKACRWKARHAGG